MSEILHGLGVSPGVAVGRVLLLEPDSHPVVRVAVSQARVEQEVGRLRNARERLRQELQDLRDRIRDVLGDHYAAVFEAQLLILDDPGLTVETERRIRQEGVSAAWALQQAVGSFMRKFDSVDQGYFRERGGDLADVHGRLQRLLRGERPNPSALPDGPLVLVAHALGPSEAVVLTTRQGVVGLATDVGGPTSHTAILAQALSVPAVVGLRDVSLRVRSGDSIILDGDRGEVELGPEATRLKEATGRRETWLAMESAMAVAREGPVTTRDGVEVVLRANIELAEQLQAAVRHGAQGVGLYRSEFLFLTRFPHAPSEQDHYGVYREMVERVAPDPAVIRTLDLGGEAYFQDVFERGESNPVLGLRGVRLCLKRPDLFLPQLRALLRAAVHGDVRILIPMVTTREEVVDVRRLLSQEAERLRADGVGCRADLPVGAMVEVPAAVATADVIARHCDFLSIGTNDLIQYALAVDRSNESVSHLYEPLHPAVLRMVDGVVRSAGAQGIPVSLCGEMAADPRLAALLVGLGLRELSVEPRALVTVAEAIRRVDSRRALPMARAALGLPAAREVALLLETAARGEEIPEDTGGRS